MADEQYVAYFMTAGSSRVVSQFYYYSTTRTTYYLLILTSTTYYFMTAGTKPPQPPVRYCPHSAGGAQLVEASEQALDEVEVDDDQLLV